jgi:hypothetical protein
MSDTTDWIKLNLPEINVNQAKMLARYIKQVRIDEVEAYADYLADQDNEAAFEMAWNEFAYKRTRQIDAEE